MTLACFHDTGKILLSKHFLTILKAYTFCYDTGIQFKKSWPITIQPRWFRYIKCWWEWENKFSPIFGKSNLKFSGIFEVINSLSFVKSGCSVSSLRLDAMLTKYSLTISAKMDASVTLSSLMFRPKISSLFPLFEDAPNPLKLFHIDLGSSFPHWTWFSPLYLVSFKMSTPLTNLVIMTSSQEP